MKSQPKSPGVKKVAAKNPEKAMLKKMQNQNGRPRPPATDGIKIFGNDDQVTKHYCCLPLRSYNFTVGRQQ